MATGNKFAAGNRVVTGNKYARFIPVSNECRFQLRNQNIWIVRLKNGYFQSIICFAHFRKKLLKLIGWIFNVWRMFPLKIEQSSIFTIVLTMRKKLFIWLIVSLNHFYSRLRHVCREDEKQLQKCYRNQRNLTTFDLCVACCRKHLLKSAKYSKEEEAKK